MVFSYYPLIRYVLSTWPLPKGHGSPQRRLLIASSEEAIPAMTCGSTFRDLDASEPQSDERTPGLRVLLSDRSRRLIPIGSAQHNLILDAC